MGVVLFRWVLHVRKGKGRGMGNHHVARYNATSFIQMDPYMCVIGRLWQDTRYGTDAFV